MSSSKIREGLLVVGIGVLILGFLLFYLASVFNWEYISTYEESVNVGYPTTVSDYAFGSYYVYPVNVPTIEMQSGDFLAIEFSSIQLPLTQHIDILLFEYGAGGLNSPEIASFGAVVSYTNFGPPEVMIVDLGIPSNQNLTSTTASLTLNLDHYETPQWVYFGGGIVLCSLAMIPIFKSKR